MTYVEFRRSYVRQTTLPGSPVPARNVRGFDVNVDVDLAKWWPSASMLRLIATLILFSVGLFGIQRMAEAQDLPPLDPTYVLGLHSINGNTSTFIQFQNNTSHKVSVFWVNYTGQLVLYATLTPCQSYVQQTYLTHPWVIQDLDANSFIVGFLPAATLETALIAPFDSNVNVQSCTPTIALLDPVPGLLYSSKVTNDRSALAAQVATVTGISADGIAQLVVRMPTLSPGNQVTVMVCTDASTSDTCSPSQSSDDDGGLLAIGSATALSQSLPNTLSDISQDSAPKTVDDYTSTAFVVYRAPVDFARSSVPADSNAASRTIYLQVTYSNDGAQYGSQMMAITVVRPPVVLIHGLGSGPLTFDYFEPFHSDSRFSRCLVDYESTDAARISVNTPIVASQVNSCIESYRLSNSVAAIQADAVVHSMGGLLIRSFANSSSFVSANNFLAGPIHKLITIGTPHLGTPLATALQVAPFVCPSSGPASYSPIIATIIFGAVVLGVDEIDHFGAVADLATGSSAIASISSPNPSRAGALIRTHVIVGVASSQQETTNAAALTATFHGLCPALTNLLVGGFHPFYGGPNDNVVPDWSEQALGLGFSNPSAFGTLSPRSVNGFPTVTRVPGVIHSVFPGVLPLGPDELAKTLSPTGNVVGAPSSVPQTVIDLLNTSINSSSFAPIVP